MNAIFSCKMYKASKNKQKIRAALSDPLNVELVTQLRSYLDEDQEEFLKISDEMNNTEHGESASDAKPREAEPEMDTFESKPTHSSNKEDEVDEPEEDSEDKGEGEESKTDSVNSGSCIVKDVASEADAVKGLLNTTSETSGVSRMTIKEDELWVHYKDDVNLNNVMEPVIALLNASGYTNLQFNRLARTENAIVFYVSSVPTSITGVKVDE